MKKLITLWCLDFLMNSLASVQIAEYIPYY